MKGLLQGRLWRALLVSMVILGWAVAGAGCGGSKVKEAAEKSNLHLQLGINYFGDQMIPQAIIELLESLKHDPKNPDALHMLGFIYMGRKDYPKAVDYYRQALLARPEFYICQNNLGTALMASGRWEEAVEVYEVLINKPTYNTPELAYNNLGWSYFQLGQIERANESLQMAVFLKPQLCLAHQNLGLVQKHQKNEHGALRYFLKAIKHCPNYVDPHFEVAQILMARRDPKAKEYFQRCYELASETLVGDRCRSYLEVYP